MKINLIEFAALTEDERTAKFATIEDADIEATIKAATERGTALFATEPGDLTLAIAQETEATMSALGYFEAERDARAAEAQKAADTFASLKAKFSGETDEDADEDAEEGDEPADDDDDAEEGDAAEEGDDAEEGDESEDGGEATTTASAVRGRRALPPASAAKKVGRKTKRPDVKASTQVVITAAANVPGFSHGQSMDNGMVDVAKASSAVAKSFAPFNARAAANVREANGGAPVLHKTATASFAVDFGDVGKALTEHSGANEEFNATKFAVEEHVKRVQASIGRNGETPTAMAAAMAWCSPSEVVYNWIADFVVDGLLSLPGIPARRGGLMLTEGPQLLQTDYATGADIDAFGFGGTEEEMEAGYVKECETIVCPEFVDHRLDFDGYCWKIPILTQNTFPELIADAMRVSDVAYAHKMNRRRIRDIISMSTAVNATSALGGSMLDTLEAIVQVAVKERRWWNIGENATLEVKLPQVAREIFKFDMSRRSGLALNDVANDAKVAAHFAAHNLAVEYLSDFDQQYGAATPTAAWPDTIRAIMYPAGTFVEAQNDVINLSTVYDAASLSQNEYTGVFYEQGIKIIKRGYRSHVVKIPVCVSGTQGANEFVCFNDGSL